MLRVRGTLEERCRKRANNTKCSHSAKPFKCKHKANNERSGMKKHELLKLQLKIILTRSKCLPLWTNLMRYLHVPVHLLDLDLIQSNFIFSKLWFCFLKSGTSPLLAKRVAAVWHLPPDLLFFASASALLQGSYARNRPQASTASLSTLRNRLLWKNPGSKLLWIAKEPKKPSRFPTKLDIPQSMLNSWQREWWYQVISSVISVCIT